MATTNARRSPFEQGFIKWAVKSDISPKKTTVANNYCTWLRGLEKRYNIDGYDIVQDFFGNGDYLYALSYCEKMLNGLSGAPKDNYWNDTRSALRCLYRYLEHVKLACTTGDHLDRYRTKLTKPELHKIDGNKGLLAAIGVNNFVKMAVEQSYFFSPVIVADRHQDLCTLFNNGSSIPARKTTKLNANANYYHQQNGSQWLYIETGTPALSIPIARDTDGNKNVRQIIKSDTGYSVCEGKGSIFQNYIISHIWGRAFDPRYFTSFWNIVLIPSWANPLMDKINPESEAIASLLQSTFQKICTDLYMNTLSNCQQIQIPSTPSVQNPNDIIHSTYNINIIEKNATTNGRLVAKITQKDITI